MNNELPFALVKWLKKQREDQEAHQAKMVVKNYKDDKEYLDFIQVVVTNNWPKLKIHEKTMFMSMVEKHKTMRCLTPAQRSFIVGSYMKYGGSF